MDISASEEVDQNIQNLLQDDYFQFFKSRIWGKKDIDLEKKKENFLDYLNEWCEDYNLRLDQVIHCLEDTGYVQDENSIEEQEITQKEILDNEFPALSKPTAINNKSIITIPEILDDNNKLSLVFKKIVRIERLREVKVYKGFQRLEPVNASAIVPPDLGQKEIKWLPAIEIFGEGILLEFKNEVLEKWYSSNKKTIDELTKDHIEKANELGLFSNKGLEPSPLFMTIHSFSYFDVSTYF